MDYQVTIRRASPHILAAVRGNANAHNIGEQIREQLSQVWDYIRASGIEHLGQNIVVYFDRESESLFLTDAGIPVEFGVLVKTEFIGSEPVICSTTPTGLTARTLHIGPYDKLGEAHTAVRNWCRDNDHTIAGPNWEIYGHWIDNPDELETEVVYLLKPQP